MQKTWSEIYFNHWNLQYGIELKITYESDPLLVSYLHKALINRINIYVSSYLNIRCVWSSYIKMG